MRRSDITVIELWNESLIATLAEQIEERETAYREKPAGSIRLERNKIRTVLEFLLECREQIKDMRKKKPPHEEDGGNSES